MICPQITSSAADLLSSMLNKGTKLWSEGGQLRYRVTRGVLSAEEIVAIQRMKGELITLLTSAGTAIGKTQQSVTRVSLTFQQEAYWDFFCGKDPTWNHFIRTALRLRGKLNVDALCRAVDAITARHESLRTRIASIAGTLIQEIDMPSVGKLKVSTAEASGSSDADDRARCQLEKFFRKRIDPAAGPTFEAHLLKLADDEYVLAVGVHHVLSDAVSVSIFFRELWVLYEELLLERPISISEVALQYSDYASWQRGARPRWIQEHGDYWKSRLAGASRLRLPIDTGIKRARPFSARQIRIPFGGTLSSALYNLARSEHTSLALVLLAAYSAVASCWCKQNDFVIPFNVTGRSRAEHIDVMGLFFHSLLLRIEVNQSDSFIELLKRTSLEFLTAHQHIDSGALMQEVPYLYEGTILQCLSLQPDEISGMSSLPEIDGDNPPVNIEPFPVEQWIIPETFNLRSDIQLGSQDTAQGILIAALYRADLFTESTVQAFLTDWRHFAEFVTRDPHVTVAAFWRAFSGRAESILPQCLRVMDSE